MSYFEIKNLTKNYIGGYSGINDVSFSIDKGETLTILSENKGGKTTILSTIAGLENVTSGEIYLEGNLINDIPIKSRDIGYLDKSLQLNNNYKVKDIIEFPLKIRKIDNNIIADKLVKIINTFGISDVLNTKIKKLTNYQKTLVGLARLLILDRKLYLIDDIFENLSKDEQENLSQLLVKLLKNKTAICAVSKYSIANKITENNILLLGYSTAVGYGNIHNREIFCKTVEGYKILNERKVCSIPCSIANGKVLLNNNEYTLKQNIVSDVFNKVILVLNSEKISFDCSKECCVYNEIDYINLDKIAYFDIGGDVATLYLGDKNLNNGDRLTFSFNIIDCNIYDFESERLIST